jgi:hypothetical protein
MTWNLTQVMMELAGITYAPVEKITDYLDDSHFATDGWEPAWGPATDEDGGNLAYVAQNATTNTYAVAVRGTYPEVGLGLLAELIEDLDVFDPVGWQYPPVAGAAVARGTLDALNAIAAMQSGGASLAQFLIKEAVPRDAKILVTGHSLGGCVASVAAPWLTHQLQVAGFAGAVTPYTYAAPTAGNTGFANWQSTCFPGVRVVNTIDVVPMAWANLPQIETLYASPGLACPKLFADVVSVVATALTGYDYAQPSAGEIQKTGSFQAEGDFFAEAAAQHAHNTYLTLLGAPVLPIFVETARVTWSQDASGGREKIGQARMRRLPEQQ